MRGKVFFFYFFFFFCVGRSLVLQRVPSTSRSLLTKKTPSTGVSVYSPALFPVHTTSYMPTETYAKQAHKHVHGCLFSGLLAAFELSVHHWALAQFWHKHPVTEFAEGAVWCTSLYTTSIPPIGCVVLEQLSAFIWFLCLHVKFSSPPPSFYFFFSSGHRSSLPPRSKHLRASFETMLQRTVGQPTPPPPHAFRH